MQIRGPVSCRTTHHKNHPVLVREYTYNYRYHTRFGKTKYYKFIVNKKYLKSLSNPDTVGYIEWEVDCPVCLKVIEPRLHYDRKKYGLIQGNTYSMEHNENVRVVKLPDHEGLVVCSQQCHDLFLLSPQIYEENYL